MSTYSDKLKDPRWQKKRLQILEEQKWKCIKCKDENTTLHVHHITYKRGNEPWDYPNSNLMCLCKDCHKEIEYIKEFYKSKKLKFSEKKLSVTKIKSKNGSLFFIASDEIHGNIFLSMYKPDGSDIMTATFSNKQREDIIKTLTF
jgi:hypothetical protein